MNGMTGEEKCAAMGLQQFDYVMPQSWFDEAVKWANPSGHIVWCYDRVEADGSPCEGAATYGYPVAIDELGRAILGMVAQK